METNSNIHIVIVTHGSRGDTQPAVVMGISLQRLGYKVSIVGLGDQKEFADRYGIQNYVGMSTTARELFEEAKEFVCGTFDLSDFINSFKEKGKKRTLKESNEILEVCKDANFIIYHPNVEYQIWSISEKFNIPCMAFLLVPWRRTCEFPPPVFEESKFPNPEDYLKSWDSTFVQASGMNTAPISEWRNTTLKLPSIELEEQYQTIAHYIHSKVPFVTCFSPEILEIPNDWDKNLVKQGGYLFMDNNDPSGWKPSKELENFLSLPEEPIYFGFGSMIHKEPDNLLKIIFESIKLTNCRAIICEGWFTLQKPKDFTPEKYGFNENQIIFVKDVPHTWLLPKCSVSIIHGGAGTTASAVLSGKPVIICPFLIDQPFWSLALKKKRLSPQIEGLSAATISSELLTKAIKEALTNEEIKTNAKQAAINLKNENGTQKVIDIIEQQIKENC